MQEDKLEALEKLFPGGYVILHMQADNHLRMAASNKNGSVMLAYFINAIMNIFNELNRMIREERGEDDAIH